MKYVFSMIAILIGAGSAPSAYALGKLARNSDGSLLLLNQLDAERYCEANGSRLPSALELAEAAKRQGAQVRHTQFGGVFVDYDSHQGIVNPSVEALRAEVREAEAAGFITIYFSSEFYRLRQVGFYYDSSKYKSNRYEQEPYECWSSTTVSRDPLGPVRGLVNNDAYKFNSRDGSLSTTSRAYALASVRCSE